MNKGTAICAPVSTTAVLLALATDTFGFVVFTLITISSKNWGSSTEKITSP